MAASILWFRHDLRLADNSALATAIDSGLAVLPVYIYAPDEDGRWAPGAASRWWLHHALQDLDAQLHAVGSRLILRRGNTLDILLELAHETGAKTITWNRRYEPEIIARDGRIKQALRQAGLQVISANSSLLHEPHTVANQSGKPFQVFTPFYKHCRTLSTPDVVEVDLAAMQPMREWPTSDPIDSWQLLPKLPWDGGFYSAWKPTRAGGLERLDFFLREVVTVYKDDRNRPDFDATSRLSPYLHFGQIGPRQIVHALKSQTGLAGEGANHFLSELYWREFAHHILFHFPRTPENPLRAEFSTFNWQNDAGLLKAWRHGQTGYPIIDAGMRQLWQTGWMHNRVRMIVGSLLVKHLLQPWQEGAAWFWETLVDADLANNTLGWQWIGGCGADAAPYFRVFNPILQGNKFDPAGDYVRKYVPELASLPTAFIHTPWLAPESALKQAGVILGETYPRPIVEHAAGRKRALDAFAAISAQRLTASVLSRKVAP